MNYAASVFDLLFPLCFLALGLYILVKGRIPAERFLGASLLALALGETVVTVFSMLRRFGGGEAYALPEAAARAAEGLALTVALLLAYKAWHGYYGEGEYHKLSRALYALAVLRLLLLLPFALATPSPLWWFLRSLPLAAVGAVVVRNYFKDRWRSARFGLVWLLFLLGTALYLPADLLTGFPGWLLSFLSRLALTAVACLFFLAVAKDDPYARRRKDA